MNAITHINHEKEERRMRKIYLASSWRNQYQPQMLAALRGWGHEVYDFRNPPGKTGFSWNELNSEKDWLEWTAAEYRENLKHPAAQAGFASDFGAMAWADTGVLLLPCGRSAHLELGWMAGQGKDTYVVTEDGQEPELMALMSTAICINWTELQAALANDNNKEIAA